MWHRVTTSTPPGDIVVTLQDTFWKKPQWVAQAHGGHIANKVVKEPGVFIQNVPKGYFGGTFQKWPACDHRSHCDQSGGYISKESSMYPLGNVWTHCLRNLNVSSMCPLGKCPLAPSDRDITWWDNHKHPHTRGYVGTKYPSFCWSCDSMSHDFPFYLWHNMFLTYSLFSESHITWLHKPS